MGWTQIRTKRPNPEWTGQGEVERKKEMERADGRGILVLEREAGKKYWHTAPPSDLHDCGEWENGRGSTVESRERFQPVRAGEAECPHFWFSLMRNYARRRLLLLLLLQQDAAEQP